MSACPNELRYTASHEWIKVEGDQAVIGITAHAQSQLGDLVFVELPILGDPVLAGKEAAVVESVKTAADVYSPVSGEVVAINDTLTAQPELINQDPYHQGWLFKVKMKNSDELEKTLSAEQYAEQHTD